MTGQMVDAATTIADFIDAMQDAGIGPDLTQRIAVAVAPVIVTHIVFMKG